MRDWTQDIDQTNILAQINMKINWEANNWTNQAKLTEALFKYISEKLIKKD